MLGHGVKTPPLILSMEPGMFYRCLLLTVVFFLVASHRGLAADDASLPNDITVLQNVPYREGPSKQWRLDLAMKKAPGGKPRPAIVVIHGGGWLEGDKSSFASRRYGVPGNIVDFAGLGFVARPKRRTRPPWRTAGAPCAGCGLMRRTITWIPTTSALSATRRAVIWPYFLA